LLDRSRGKKMALAREKRRIEVTLKELEAPCPTIYKAIGRMSVACSTKRDLPFF